MARGFTEEERYAIRLNLLEKGREFFGKNGLKKTSIEDLTKAVGISQGSFYSFFDSKDELYLEVIQRELELIRGIFLNSDLLKERLTKERFKLLFKKAVDQVTSNPIIKGIFLEDEFELLIKKISPEKIKKEREKVLNELIPLIKKCQKDGSIIDKPPEIIAQVLQYAFLPMIHKQGLEEHIFEETIDLFLDILAKGLIIEDDN